MSLRRDRGPSTCSHRASAARGGARDDREFKVLLVVARDSFFPRHRSCRRSLAGHQCAGACPVRDERWQSSQTVTVILSAVTASLREAVTESKDPYRLMSPWSGRGPSTCSHRASAARGGARDDREFKRSIGGRGEWFLPRPSASPSDRLSAILACTCNRNSSGPWSRTNVRAT